MKNKFGSYLKEYLEFYNISIMEFAERIETSPKNLIDILNGKVSISQNLIYNISFITDIPVSFIQNMELGNKLENNINDYLNSNNININTLLKRFEYKKLQNKYSLVYHDENNKYHIMEDIMKYLRIVDLNVLYKDDNSIFYKSNNNKKELLALWLERCYRLTKEQSVKEYKKENINVLVDYIVKNAKKNIFDEKELTKIFNENGIYLVIEDDLPGSKIRGAFRVLVNKPAIYITKKYKRYADIYFALLHELAHCKSDYNRAKSGGIISLDDNSVKEDYEINADKTAFNWMVDDKQYDIIKNNLDIFNDLDVVKSFVVYRLAYDKKIDYKSDLYQANNLIIK